MRRAVLGIALALGAAACGGAAVGARSQLAEMDGVRQGPAAREALAVVPQAMAKADQERELAKRAEADGDDVGAALHAERAIAGYTHAFVLARLARATKDEAESAAALATAHEDARQLAAARAQVEREGDELDKQLKVAREAIAPTPSGPADPQREAARVVAARALVTQARLLCGAARLVAPDLPDNGAPRADADKAGTAAGLADAEKALDELDKTLDAPGAPRAARGSAPSAIDAAARARVTCLGLLTKARRAGAASSATSGQSDALLAELSAAGGWEPTRDERGVVVALHGLFKGAQLTSEGEAKLVELGRIAAAHPGFAVQVVVHDDAPPSAQERAGDAQRGDACVKALVTGGAASRRVHAELAGARAPLVDPKDGALRARNARVDVVFVAGPPGG